MIVKRLILKKYGLYSHNMSTCHIMYMDSLIIYFSNYNHNADDANINDYININTVLKYNDK